MTNPSILISTDRRNYWCLYEEAYNLLWVNVIYDHFFLESTFESSHYDSLRELHRHIKECMDRNWKQIQLSIWFFFFKLAIALLQWRIPKKNHHNLVSHLKNRLGLWENHWFGKWFWEIIVWCFSDLCLLKLSEPEQK